MHGTGDVGGIIGAQVAHSGWEGRREHRSRAARWSRTREDVRKSDKTLRGAFGANEIRGREGGCFKEREKRERKTKSWSGEEFPRW